MPNYEDEAFYGAEWEPTEHLRQFREAHDLLIERLDEQGDQGRVNVDEMVRLYSQSFDQPILTLVQDMQTQIVMYYNVFEDLKKGITEDEAVGLKQRYQGLGVIPSTNKWPNPLRDWLMNTALSKMRDFTRALREIMARWRTRIIEELHLEGTMAVGFQMTLSVPPAFTITIQPEVSVALVGN